MYGGQERCTGFWWGVQKKETQLGKPRHRWVDCINMDLQEIDGVEGQCLDQSDLTQDKESWQSIVNVVMYFWF